MSDSDLSPGSHDDSFAVPEDLVEVPEYKRAGTQAVNFDGLLEPPVKLHEDLKNGCGGQLWPAGMVLAKYLLRSPQFETLARKSIIELGAGGGLTGLGLAQKINYSKNRDEWSGTHILLTDLAIHLDLMQMNISQNDLPSSLVEAAELDWSWEKLNVKQPDILLAADCVYFEPAFPLLIRTMKLLIGPNTICYFCFKKRRRADLRFVKDAKKIFDVQDIQDDPDRPVWSRENLYLYKITAKAPR